MTRAGLHQHRRPAASCFLEGGFMDYQGYAGRGELGVTVAGATDSALAFADTLMVSRRDTPMIYPEEICPRRRIDPNLRGCGCVCQ